MLLHIEYQCHPIYLSIYLSYLSIYLSIWCLSGKESTCNARDMGSVPGLGRSLEMEMATHPKILAWEIPWTEEPGGLQSMELQKSPTRLSDSTTTAKIEYAEDLKSWDGFRYLWVTGGVSPEQTHKREQAREGDGRQGAGTWSQVKSSLYRIPEGDVWSIIAS